jgi:RNA polymerase sigma factor (TIGR02999 family)
LEGHDQVTRLLEDYSAGDESVVDGLIPLVYPDLRRIAHRRLRSEPAALTLDTTALVHETYLNLVDQTRCDWNDRAHFFAVASRLMRRVLIDYARRKKAEKRGGGAVRVTLQEEMAATDPRFGDLLALDDALEELSAHHERMGRVVECRFFGGMTVEETAAALDVSTRTVERDWTRARAYLKRKLRPATTSPDP